MRASIVVPLMLSVEECFLEVHWGGMCGLEESIDEWVALVGTLEEHC